MRQFGMVAMALREQGRDVSGVEQVKERRYQQPAGNRNAVGLSR